jgi:hypothetical protein
MGEPPSLLTRPHLCDSGLPVGIVIGAPGRGSCVIRPRPTVRRRKGSVIVDFKSLVPWRERSQVPARRYGDAFSRPIRVPFPVKEEQIDATYDKGVLTLKLP